MGKTVQAVYENGVFRPSEPVAIAEGARVELTVHPATPETGGSPEAFRKALAEIAALPLEGPRDGFSGADHDKVLYGDVDGDGDVR